MLKSNEMKLDINEKRAELEKFQREERIQEAQNAATELNKMVDALNVQLALEKSDFENFLKEAEPLSSPTGDSKEKLRNRAFNKLVLKRGRLTEEERQAYLNVSNEEGQLGRPGQIESISEYGGYLVPEEQLTTIREYRKAYAQLKDCCHVIYANSTKGKWPTLGEETGLLLNFTEMTSIKESDFEFGQADYEIADYGDIIPVSNQLIADANVNILSIVGQRLARKVVNTENSLILSKLAALKATTISSFQGLNKALIKDLDPVYWANAKIFTNQDGFLWLSNLVDAQQRPLLQPDVVEPNVYRYRGKPVVVLPNSILANTTTTGSSPTTTAPFYIGNLSDYLMFFERQGVEIATSTEYLFAKYATALRCVVRFGVALDDVDSMKAYNVAIG